MLFYPGLHQPSDARHFERAFISVNRLRSRKSDFQVGDWIMDSGAFTEISRHGEYRTSPEDYVAQIERWRRVGNLQAAVTQDWMCEPFITQKTGRSVQEHQELTIARYELIQGLTDFYIMPVLQGYAIDDYVRHLEMYGDRLAYEQWVGVGSICKRNTNVGQIEDILVVLKSIRPDLRLHGFGLKTTALNSNLVWQMLHTADSMAWSFAARKQGRNANDWREADQFRQQIESKERQTHAWIN